MYKTPEDVLKMVNPIRRGQGNHGCYLNFNVNKRKFPGDRQNCSGFFNTTSPPAHPHLIPNVTLAWIRQRILHGKFNDILALAVVPRSVLELVQFAKQYTFRDELYYFDGRVVPTGSMIPADLRIPWTDTGRGGRSGLRRSAGIASNYTL